ncbi:MAG: hypothetical protein M1825_000173 [Sarcosagium campestre]|nr:MAG: hypothetical protein M1825_000173 [Sarcosagium campestre]
MALHPDLIQIQQRVWDGSLPLRIRLSRGESRTYDGADPYVIQVARLSYLPLLLPRIRAFFNSALIEESSAAHDGWFSFEGVPLKWHYPIGLLYDLFSGAEPAEHGLTDSETTVKLLVAGGEESDPNARPETLPWTIEVHFKDWPHDQLVGLDAEGKVLHDSFMNGVKEADFLRNGSAKGIMTLSKDDSTKLWAAVQTRDLVLFNSINQRLLNPAGASLRHVPVRIYLPSSDPQGHGDGEYTNQASLKVVQSLVTPWISGSKIAIFTPQTGADDAIEELQTIGTALHRLLPSLFPSRRTPTLARPVLHGAVLSLSTPMQEAMRATAYADGWLHISVEMMG